MKKKGKFTHLRKQTRRWQDIVLEKKTKVTQFNGDLEEAGLTFEFNTNIEESKQEEKEQK